MVRQLTKGRLPKPLAAVISATLALFWVVMAPVGVASAATGGFEIDGNQVSNGGPDWASVEGVDVVRDPIGNADASTLSGSERGGWTTGQVGTPSGKSDIGNVLVYDQRDASGDTWAYFAWDRAGDTGTGRYYIELNQAEYSGVQPVRTVGDVRITIGINGADLLVCQRVETWSGSAWTGAQDCSAVVEVEVNSQPVTDYFSSPNAVGGVLGTNQFVEAAINLSDFGLTTCPVSGFSTIHMRSQEGNENGDTSQLKDYAVGAIDIDSDCASLEIVKLVDGPGDGSGAVFVIEPDPTAGSSEPFLVVTTGAGGRVTVPEVAPGDYTVTELAPPAGYLLPADAEQEITAAPYEDVTVSFSDTRGSMTFSKHYAGTAPDTGASFRLTRTHEWQYDTDPAGGFSAPSLAALAGGRTVDVTDNGTGDANSQLGVVRVTGLEGGTWCITETAAPTGWKPAPGEQVCDTVGPTDATSEANVDVRPEQGANFHNALRTVALEVHKTGSVPGSSQTYPLSGVKFTLYTDDGDQVFDAGDVIVSEQVTDAAGMVSWTGLNWQKDYWLQETKRQGYLLGLDPNPVMVSFDAPSQDGYVQTINVDNPREEVTVELLKTDAVDGTDLDGGAFQLWRESNDTPGLQTQASGGTAADTNVNGDVALVDGKLTFDPADHHIPWGFTYYLYEAEAPAGYGLMTPNPIVVDARAIGTAGTTLTFEATDPRETTELEVRKVNGDGEELAGAHFRLWKSADGVLDKTADSIVDSCITGADGLCGIDGLQWGWFYFWEETKAPAGYNLPTETVQGPVQITRENYDGDLTTVTFVDYMTVLTTTPFVGGSAVEDLGTDVARIDENDVVSDRAELAGLSQPATGTVTFSLYGPFQDTTLNGLSFEAVDCDGEPVFVSDGNEIAWNGDAGWYEAFSEELAVGDAGLEPGLYQWVADFESTDAKNLGATGDCPDVTEQFVVRAGDEPGIDKTSDPESGTVVQPGTVVTYSVTVSNSGDMPIPAEEAVVVDTLSPYLEFIGMVDESAPQPSSISAVLGGSTEITWNVGELAPGSAVRLDYLVYVSDDAPQGWVVDNTACFFEECVGTTHRVPTGDLTIVKTVDPASGTGVLVGEELTYTMTVTATGALNQREVLVVDNVPGTDPNHPGSLRTTYVAGSADCLGAGVCEVYEPGTDGEIVWYLGDLEAGQSRQVTFQVTVDAVTATGEGRVDVGDVVNQAWTGSYDTDWTSSNEVVNPVAVVLGVKVPAKPEVKVLGTKLPRTGAGLGLAVWVALALLVLGAGARAAGRQARHRA